ncbi:hypothetical protein ACTXT7_007453 [Hymenolepis weldensis]
MGKQNLLFDWPNILFRFAVYSIHSSDICGFTIDWDQYAMEADAKHDFQANAADELPFCKNSVLKPSNCLGTQEMTFSVIGHEPSTS